MRRHPVRLGERLACGDSEHDFFSDDVITGLLEGAVEMLPLGSCDAKRRVYWQVAKPFDDGDHTLSFNVSGGMSNTNDRKRLAETMRKGYPFDSVTPKWLLDRQRDHARLHFIILGGGTYCGSFLVNASLDYPRIRRDHSIGYRLEPGSSDVSLGVDAATGAVLS